MLSKIDSSLCPLPPSWEGRQRKGPPDAHSPLRPCSPVLENAPPCVAPRTFEAIVEKDVPLLR